jgi:putative aldouronate transport system substrate-binding protein
MRHIFLVVLTLVVLAGAVFASGGGEQATAAAGVQLNPPGTYPITKEPASFTAVTIYLPGEMTGKLTDNRIDQYMTKLTNVKVIWKDVIGNEAAQKISLMLASGDLPDAIMTPFDISAQQAYIYGSQGTFIALNGLIKSRMPGLSKLYQKFPDYQKQLTAPDGNIYALPYLEGGCFHCTMSYKFYVYQPWLTKLGLKMPTTTDELYNVLKAFKTRDPNGNGKADEVPLIGATTGWRGDPLTFLMNAFTYTDIASFMKREGGKVTFIPATNEYRDGLKYISKLYKEGLIAPETWVQKEEQAKATVENPDVPLVGSFAGGWWATYSVHAGGTGRYKDFKAVSPFAGPTGLRQATFNAQGANPHTFITKAAKNPELIASWADWFYEEPLYAKQLMAWDFLEEGVDWRLATPEEQKTVVSRDGNPAVVVMLVSPKTKKQYGQDKFDDGYTRAAPRFDWRQWDGLPPSDANDPTKSEYRLMVETRDVYAPFKADKSMPPNLVAPADVAQEFADITAALVPSTGTGVVTSWTTEFITGSKDINDDGQWQAFIAELKKAGYERYEKIWADMVKRAGY